MDNQNSIFTCPVFDLTFRHGQAHAFLWTTKFQSGQVNPKSYLSSLATKVYGSVCSTGIAYQFTVIAEHFHCRQLTSLTRNNFVCNGHMHFTVYLIINRYMGEWPGSGWSTRSIQPEDAGYGL